MACLNAIANVSLLAGPLQLVFSGVMVTGWASRNAPLASVVGDALSAASPAVEVTVAVLEAVYSCATPGVNEPNEAGAPSVSDNVAGTAPPAEPSTTFARSPVTTATSVSALSWNPSDTRTFSVYVVSSSSSCGLATVSWPVPGAMANTPASLPPVIRQVNVRRFGRLIFEAQSSAWTAPTGVFTSSRARR